MPKDEAYAVSGPWFEVVGGPVSLLNESLATGELLTIRLEEGDHNETIGTYIVHRTTSSVRRRCEGSWQFLGKDLYPADRA